MALCFAHTAAGYLAYEIARPLGRHRPGLLLGAIAIANAPDLDFLPGILLGHPGAYHRGVTHTLAAVVMAAVVALVIARRHRRPWFAAAWVGAMWVSHLLLDFVSSDVVPPHGGQFLWPLSSAYYHSPVTLLPEIVVDGSGRGPFLASLLEPHTWRVWAVDIGVLLSAILGVALVRGWRARSATGAALAGLPEGM